MLKIKIGRKNYDISTKFRACAAVAPLIADVDMNNPMTLITAILEHGADIVQKVIESTDQKPVPTKEEIEDAFDKDEGIAGEIVMAFIEKTSNHITRARVDEVTAAAEGN